MERCRECSGRRLAFHTARAAFIYGGPTRHLVRAWKERGLRRLAPFAAELIAERLAPPAVDVITYIAPDPLRQLGRDRHPAESLAAELARLWGVPDAHLLRRTRSSVRQASLPRQQRHANARGSFEAAPGVPRRVLLVDDVYTTGATASAAATALRSAGAARVEVVTLARAVR